MDTIYYRNSFKPALLRVFKQAFNLQEFADKELTHAINKQRDPVEMLEYLRDSVYVTIKEEAEMLRPMLASIREIASRTKYYARHGSTVVSVSNDFIGLTKSMKMRKGENGVVTVLGGQNTVVTEERKPQVEKPSVKANKESTNLKLTPTTYNEAITVDKGRDTERVSTVVDNKVKVNKHKIQSVKIHMGEESADNKNQTDKDDDWVVLEEDGINDFVTV